MSEKIVGHKTYLKDGVRKHSPLYESEAQKIMQQIEESDERKKILMPDERAAINMFFDAYQRLIDLGWKPACYCPKDGQIFDVIEVGSTGIHKCIYSGNWPNGSYLVHDDYDSYQSHPVLCRLPISTDAHKNADVGIPMSRTDGKT